MDDQTENRLFESLKKSGQRDLVAGQRDLINRMNEPGFSNQRSKGTFRVLTDAEIAERRGDY